MAGAAICICGWSLEDCGGPHARTTACFATSEGWMDKDTTVTRQSDARSIKFGRNWIDRIIHYMVSNVFVVNLIFRGDIQRFLKYKL